MSGAEIAQIIVAMATLVTAIGSFVMSWVNRQSIKVVKAQTDGLMTIVKADAEKYGQAIGRKEGKAEEIEYQRHQAEAHPAEPTKVEIVNIPEILPGIADKEPVKVEITKIPPLPKA